LKRLGVNTALGMGQYQLPCRINLCASILCLSTCDCGDDNGCLESRTADFKSSVVRISQITFAAKTFTRKLFQQVDQRIVLTLFKIFPRCTKNFPNIPSCVFLPSSDVGSDVIWSPALLCNAKLTSLVMGKMFLRFEYDEKHDNSGRAWCIAMNFFSIPCISRGAVPTRNPYCPRMDDRKRMIDNL
jgi:hypothetical protein